MLQSHGLICILPLLVCPADGVPDGIKVWIHHKVYQCMSSRWCGYMQQVHTSRVVLQVVGSMQTLQNLRQAALSSLEQPRGCCKVSGSA